MATNDIYRNILETMPEGLAKNVLKVLANLPQGSRINRPTLVYLLFGKTIIKGDLQTSKEDRQIRRAITNLQNLGVPVFSDSEKGGYGLGTEAECAEYLKELINRRKALDEKIASVWKTQTTFFGQISAVQSNELEKLIQETFL